MAIKHTHTGSPVPVHWSTVPVCVRLSDPPVFPLLFHNTDTSSSVFPSTLGICCRIKTSSIWLSGTWCPHFFKIHGFTMNHSSIQNLVWHLFPDSAHFLLWCTNSIFRYGLGHVGNRNRDILRYSRCSLPPKMFLFENKLRGQSGQVTVLLPLPVTKWGFKTCE